MQFYIKISLSTYHITCLGVIFLINCILRHFCIIIITSSYENLNDICFLNLTIHSFYESFLDEKIWMENRYSSFAFQDEQVLFPSVKIP